MATHVVTSFNLVNQFKTSRYFKINLGLVPHIDKGGRRELNSKDSFAFFYNRQYNAVIYGQGNIGDIKFYTDHSIKDTSIAIYFGENFEEFVFKFDYQLVQDKGIDFYIGHLMKNVEESYDERQKKNELKKLEPVPEGDPNKVFTNPGNVSYADLKAYLDQKQKNRFKNNTQL
jgi:hypothetical protein